MERKKQEERVKERARQSREEAERRPSSRWKTPQKSRPSRAAKSLALSASANNLRAAGDAQAMKQKR